MYRLTEWMVDTPLVLITLIKFIFRKQIPKHL